MLLAPIIVPVLYALDTAVEFAFTANVAAKNNFLTLYVGKIQFHFF